MVVGLCQLVWSSPFSCRWFGFAGWNWQNTSWCIVCVCQHNPWGTTSFGVVSGSGTYMWTPSRRCSMCFTERSVWSSEDVFRSVDEMECSNGFDMWAAMVRSDESAFWRVRRSSAANWGGMAMREGAGVCAPVACWRRVTSATVGLGGRAWSLHDSSCNAPALVRALIWSFEGLEFGRKRLGCQKPIWCSSEEWQVTKTALSGTWGVSSAGVCWTLLWFGVLGVELVFNSVAGFSGGVSCPSEVRVFTVLWEWGEAMLFSVANLFSLSLPFRPTASQAESGFSFFSHFRSSSFRWKNSFIIISIIFCESKCGGVSCSCVDSVWARSVWNLGEFFRWFLGLTAPGWVCRFPLEFPYELGWFHDLSHGLSWGLAWSHDLSQCRPGERWRPRGPSQWSYLCLGRVPACESRSLLEGDAFHSLCGGLALCWRWVPSKSSQVTFIYIALLTIQIVTKHCTISK